MKRTLALILAAGRGTRAGEGLPKTYRLVEGEPVLRKTARAFIEHAEVTDVQIVIHPDDMEYYQNAVEGWPLPEPVFGGATRASSVQNGLSAHHDYDFVLIHDGARPFVSQGVISAVLQALRSHQGAIPAIALTDALWRVDGQNLSAPKPRDDYRLAQTPQGFHFDLYKSMAQGGTALDDAATAHQNGLDVVWVEGDKDNRKLTYFEDF